MAETIRRVDYFYATVADKLGEGYRLLERLKERGVNLLAFTAFPAGEGQAQLDFFPESAEQMLKAAAEEGITLIGPKKAFLIQGEDRAGALVEHHQTLFSAGINIHAANAVSDGRGGFGCVLWVKPEDYENAAKALGV